MTTNTPWPAGVIARYVTRVGATVDLREDPTTGNYVDGGDCTGCGHRIDRTDERYARQQAQDHANACSSLPRPTA